MPDFIPPATPLAVLYTFHTLPFWATLFFFTGSQKCGGGEEGGALPLLAGEGNGSDEMA